MADVSICPLCAKSRLTHRSKKHRYSITSSAATGSLSGTPMLASRLQARMPGHPPQHRVEFGRLDTVRLHHGLHDRVGNDFFKTRFASMAMPCK